MRMVRFAGVEERLPEVGLGTSRFGSQTSREESFAVMDAYRDAGGTLLDTAHVYGGGQPGGKSPCEETVGAWLSSRRARHSMFIVAKGGHPAFDFATRTMGPSRVTVAALTQDLEMTLDSLRTDTVDLYLPHRDDPSVPVEVILQWLERQVKAGTIRYYGCSNWSVSRMREAQDYATAYGLSGFVCSQIEAPVAKINEAHLAPMNMTSLDEETLRFHERTGLPLMTAVTLCGGYFHRLLAGRELTPLQKRMFANPENEALAKALARFAGEGWPLTALLHAANLSHPFAALSLMGFSSVRQFEEDREAFETPVPEEITKELWQIRFGA